MLLQLNGIEYSIHFQHNRKVPRTFESAALEPSWQQTICKIHAGRCQIKGCPEGIPIIGMGVAHCSEQDDFDKAKGRKLSFGRAIQQSFSRVERDQFWTEYFKVWPFFSDPFNQERIIEISRKTLMEIASDKLSMEEISTASNLISTRLAEELHG